jgi:hypothetical protein
LLQFPTKYVFLVHRQYNSILALCSALRGGTGAFGWWLARKADILVCCQEADSAVATVQIMMVATSCTNILE